MIHELRLVVAVIALPFAWLATARAAETRLPTAEELVERSIGYHDPGNAWSTKSIEIVAVVRLAERLATDRGYATRTDRVMVNNAAEQFRYRSVKGADRIEIVGDGKRFRAWLNESAEFDAAAAETHRLTADRLPTWRDYFTFVYGIPMKLRDPGTLLDPAVRRVEFEGREVYAVRVTYSPEVGSDVWYFYIDPESFALVGCRFFHDEEKNDGEYIVLEGEIEGSHGLRLPRNRRWHMNVDGEYIAVDEITALD